MRKDNLKYIFLLFILSVIFTSFCYSQLVAPKNPRWLKVYKSSITVGWDWEYNFSTTTYKVEVATSNNFGNIVFSSTTVRNSTVTVSGLFLNTEYYGRVTAYDGLNSSSAFISGLKAIKTHSDFIPAITYIDFIGSFEKNEIYYNLPTSPTTVEIEFNKYISTDSLSFVGNIYIVWKKDHRRENKNLIINPDIKVPDPNTQEGGKHWDYFALGVDKISVSANLSAGGEYELIITTGLLDTVYTPLEKEYVYNFYTIVNSSTTSNLVRPHGSKIELLVPIKGLDNGMFLVSNILFSTNVISYLPKLPPMYNLTDFLEVRCYDSTHNKIKEINKDMLLSYTYNDLSGDNFVDGTITYAPTLSFWKLDDEREVFIKVPSIVDEETRTVSAKVKTFGIYAIGGTPKVDIEEVICFPVPWVPESGKAVTGNFVDGITFANLPYLCEISIYTIFGELVRRIDVVSNTGEYKWDGKNESGHDLASGVYLWVLKTSSQVKKGKLIIVR